MLEVASCGFRLGLETELRGHSACSKRKRRLSRHYPLHARSRCEHGVVRLKAHDEDTLNAFEQAARERPEIVECFSMGGESDYAVRMVVASIDAYEHLLKKVLLHFPGVAEVHSHFALKCVKNTTRLPI